MYRWLAAIAALGACQPEDLRSCDPPRGEPVAWFADVTAASGVAFEYISPDFKGSGLAVADLDGDGDPELIAARRTGGLAMFDNLGGLRFAPVERGIDPGIAASAIAAADLDNDGDLDVVTAGNAVTRIHENDGAGRFRPAAELTGTGVTEHVLPVDLDGDGLLDLFLSNYDVRSTARTSNRVFVNRGGLQFADGGLHGGGYSWTATALDHDGDGDLDLYVSNDTLLADFGGGNPPNGLTTDAFLRNDGVDADGTPRFTDLAVELGLSAPRSSMGGVLADLDGDHQLDLYVPDFGTNKLFVRGPEGYTDVAPALGLTARSRRNAQCEGEPMHESCLLLSWSAVAADFDLDGVDELFVVNGQTSVGDSPPVVLFARDRARDDAGYRELAPDLACADARALVVTDLDTDGDQDLVIAPKDGALLVYETLGVPPTTRWLTVRLRGSASNRMGAGAIVTLRQAGGRVQVKPVAAGGVIHSSSPAEAVFGLGDAPVERIEVAWPSGRRSELDGAASGVVVIDER